ncbi:hypothetical protein K2Z83_27105 [Oscillochloris sp. ZM17-4]|uniref:hypothetical protein n=1 Tax=Oscillochloris sp. ZM17-4 TaxID=2866714 RepID=UPI001C72B034|nr:hypothetical protein [Oscillochloris sp. ZM17-4]MBX0331324.1 hypothetical protein [Oscillochloris sp. ZM17-4]
MATITNSSTPPAPIPSQSLSIWLVSEELAELHAEMEHRNAERVKNAARLGQTWRPLDLAETAELVIAELMRAAAQARTEGGAQ